MNVTSLFSSRQGGPDESQGRPPALPRHKTFVSTVRGWTGKIPWRRERLPTPVFWPGEFHGLYSPWGHKELDTTEWLSLPLHFMFIKDKNACSLLLSTMDSHTAIWWRWETLSGERTQRGQSPTPATEQHGGAAGTWRSVNSPWRNETLGEAWRAHGWAHVSHKEQCPESRPRRGACRGIALTVWF